MSVRFTNKNIYVQFVDDTAGKTLAAASTLSKEAKNGGKLAANVKSAQVVGKLAAMAALAQGIKEVVFDRGGARYHQSKSKDGKMVCGKLATLANAARTAGLKF